MTYYDRQTASRSGRTNCDSGSSVRWHTRSRPRGNLVNRRLDVGTPTEGGKAAATGKTLAGRCPTVAGAAASWPPPPGAVIHLAAVPALVLRLFELSRPGYFSGFTQYDDGAYFGNAVRLVHGAIAYRNFAMVQPPGSMLLRAPVAPASPAGSPPGWRRRPARRAVCADIKQRNTPLGCLGIRRTLPAEPSPGGTRCRGRAKCLRHDRAGQQPMAGA